MKRKINWKLTVCLVSLFIGIVLIAFCNKIPAVFCLGLICCAVSIFFFAYFRSKNIDKVLELTQKDIDEEVNKEQPDQALLNEVYVEMKKLRKQKRSMNISFNTFAVLLVVFAIFVLF